MKHLVLASILLLIPSSVNNFDEENIKVKGVVIVHYNAEFNANNNYVDVARVKDCKVFTAWIDKEPQLKQEQGIRSVPTIILYNNGKEFKRWEAGLKMKLDMHYSELQQEVDKLTGANKW